MQHMGEAVCRLENMGAQMVKGVASKTSDIAGDGATTATVLAQSIVNEGMKFVAAGMNPMDLKRGIDKAVIAITAELKNISKPCTTNKEIAQVGSTSANSDSNYGYNAAIGQGWQSACAGWPIFIACDAVASTKMGRLFMPQPTTAPHVPTVARSAGCAVSLAGTGGRLPGHRALPGGGE